METSTQATAGAGSAGSTGSGAGTSAGASSTGAGVASTPLTPNSGTGTGSPGVTPGSGVPVTDGAQGAGALDHDAMVEAMVQAAAAKGFAGTQAQPEAAAATTPEAPVVDPAAAEAAAAEAAAPVEQPATEGEPEHSYSLDQDGFVGARDLAAEIDGNEALKAALTPELRSKIMANARIAQEGAAFKEIFSSPEEARVISDTAKEFAGFQEAFVSITPDNVAQGTTELISKLLQASYRRDDDGNVLMRDGKPVTDGTVGRFLAETSKRWFDHNIVQKVEAAKDESLSAALDLVMERAGLRPSTADQGQQVDPAIAAKQAELDRQLSEVRSQQEAARQESVKSYKSTLNTQLGQVWDDEMGKLLGLATGLSDFDRENVQAQLDKATRDAIRASTAYRREKDLLEMRPMGDKRRADEIALARKFLRTNLANIARPILAKAGVSVTAKAGARQEAQAAREQASRGEVRSGAAVQPMKAGQMTPAQERASVTEALQQKLGRAPDDSEVNQEMMIRHFEQRRKTA